MGYSNITLIKRIVAQALTTGLPNGNGEPLDVLRIGTEFDPGQITEELVDQYIQWADSQIDASLSELYVTPLSEKVIFETRLYASIDEYNEYVITTNTSPFYPGDVLVLTDGVNQDIVVVETIIDMMDRNVFQTTQSVGYEFSADNTRVLKVSYPDPIPLTSARLAAANIYEKFFMSQTDPNQSSYGTMLRKLARQDINNILNGRTILHGQKRIGNRFYNPTLNDRYGLPPLEGNNNNIDELG